MQRLKRAFANDAKSLESSGEPAQILGGLRFLGGETGAAILVPDLVTATTISDEQLRLHSLPIMTFKPRSHGEEARRDKDGLRCETQFYFHDQVPERRSIARYFRNRSVPDKTETEICRG